MSAMARSQQLSKGRKTSRSTLGQVFEFVNFRSSEQPQDAFSFGPESFIVRAPKNVTWKWNPRVGILVHDDSQSCFGGILSLCSQKFCEVRQLFEVEFPA